MKRQVISAGVTLILCSSFFAISAQKKTATPKPDFSGSWVLDLEKSDKKGIPSKPDVPIKISHQDPEFRITQTLTLSGNPIERESVYYTDERGETNQATAVMTANPGSVKPEDLDKQMTKSKPRWSGDKLITVSTLRLTAAGHVIEYRLVDEWKLSKDGKILTKISKTVFQGSNAMFVPAIVPDTKKVYNRT